MLLIDAWLAGMLSLFAPQALPLWLLVLLGACGQPRHLCLKAAALWTLSFVLLTAPWCLPGGASGWWRLYVAALLLPGAFLIGRYGLPARAWPFVTAGILCLWMPVPGPSLGSLAILTAAGQLDPGVVGALLAFACGALWPCLWAGRRLVRFLAPVWGLRAFCVLLAVWCLLVLLHRDAWPVRQLQSVFPGWALYLSTKL